MENPGEHIVGQYLKEIKKCDFVEYNLHTRESQGEIDVVGINTSEKIVYVCEVATHLGGLQYTKSNRPDNQRFIKKFEKDIHYANSNFKGYKKKYMLWTPIIRIPTKKTKYNQLNDLQKVQKELKSKFNVNLDLIFNETYYDCIQQLREVVRKEFTNRKTTIKESPIMRFIQIEEMLKKKKKD